MLDELCNFCFWVERAVPITCRISSCKFHTFLWTSPATNSGIMQCVDVFSPDIVAGLWTACGSDFLFVWSVQDILRTVLVHGSQSRTVSILTVWGIQSQKFLPVKLGVLSINVMKFLVCREYKWMLFLPSHSFWSGIVFGLYTDVHLMQRLRIYWALPPLLFISTWHGA